MKLINPKLSGKGWQYWQKKKKANPEQVKFSGRQHSMSDTTKTNLQEESRSARRIPMLPEGRQKNRYQIAKSYE